MSLISQIKYVEQTIISKEEPGEDASFEREKRSMTTIRDFGDGKTVVIHTNDRNLASRLGNYKACFNIVPYEQEQYSNRKLALVGIDFYFQKKVLRALLKKIGIPYRGLQKFEEFQIGEISPNQNLGG